MVKYTDRILECAKCQKKNSFLVSIVTEGDSDYYLTQCPRCKTYEEVKRIEKEVIASLSDDKNKI